MFWFLIIYDMYSDQTCNVSRLHFITWVMTDAREVGQFVGRDIFHTPVYDNLRKMWDDKHLILISEFQTWIASLYFYL